MDFPFSADFLFQKLKNTIMEGEFMKKISAFLTSLAVALSAIPYTAFADDTTVPADVDPIAYEQLLLRNDLNDDGIFTEEELISEQWLNLDLTGVEDISWISRMENLYHINLQNGNITDLSFLSELPKLKNVFLTSVPITNIDFAKNMELDYLRMTDMEQITFEQRMEAARCGDITIRKGFVSTIGCLPVGIIDAEQIVFRIDNTDIASFKDDIRGEDEKGFYRNGEIAAVYGRNCGETSYSIEFDGKVLFTGKIKVEEPQYADIPPAADIEYTSEIYSSNFYSDKKAVISNGRLYGVKDGKVILHHENIEKYDNSYLTINLMGDDLILTSEGKAYINNIPVTAPEGVKFRDINDSYLISENNELYILNYNNGVCTADYVCDNIASFSQNSFRSYCISTEGELLYLDNYTENNKRLSTPYPTGIMNPTSTTHDFFVDENNVLWEINTRKIPPVVTQKAEDVVKVGFLTYDNGVVTGDVHIKSDGTAYKIGTQIKVTLYEGKSQGKIFRESGYFGVPHGEIMSSQLTPHEYYISNDNVLTLEHNGKEVAINDVAEFLCDYYENDVLTCYFVRTDNTIWSYCFATDEFICHEAVKSEKSVKGDLNGDGAINVADAVLMEKYLLGGDIPIKLENGNFDSDNAVTVFDFILMRKEIIKRGNLS